MKINQQLNTIRFCFIAVIGLIILLIASGVFGVWTLNKRQDWVDHTADVLQKIEIAERTFSNADYAGRNQVIAGTENPRLKEYRESAFIYLNQVKQSITDNPVQLDYVNQLETAMRDNFAVQDEQLKSVVKTQDAIIYRIDTTAKRVQYTEAVDRLFTHIKLNEMNLLHENRMPRLFVWQSRLVKFGGVIIVLLLSSAVALYVFSVRLMRRNISAIEYIENLKHVSESNKQVDDEELQKILKFIREDIDVEQLHTTKA